MIRERKKIGEPCECDMIDRCPGGTLEKYVVNLYAYDMSIIKHLGYMIGSCVDGEAICELYQLMYVAEQKTGCYVGYDNV